VGIDLDSAKRVEQSLIAGGLLKTGASMSGLHDTTIVGG
jgi:NitT/TauT family transport system substrate-binding protein